MSAADPLVLAKQGDPRPQDGPLALCPSCGVLIRWLRTIKGKTVPVAPYRLRGNWHRPLEGYGVERQDGKPPETRGLLYVLPTCPKRASASGWEGGAQVFMNPGSHIEGYRPHFADCSNPPRKRTAAGRSPALQTA